MNLWLSGLLLVAGLFLSCSAFSPQITPLQTFEPTVEECRPLITPLQTFEPSYGRWIFIMGWITSDPHRELFKTTKSQWIDFVKTSANDKEFIQEIGIRHPTYCKYGAHPVTIHSNSAMTDKSRFTCTYHSLPTCEDCLLYTVDSRTNNNLIHIMNITEPKTIAEVESYRAFYLMAKDDHVKHHELVHAMKQARCLGFTGEPDFIYDPKDTLCEKGKEK